LAHQAPEKVVYLRYYMLIYLWYKVVHILQVSILKTSREKTYLY
jgi:hypothetical protein